MKKWLIAAVLAATLITGCTSKAPAPQSASSPLTPAITPDQHGSMPSQFQMIDEKVGWATSSDGVLRTIDGGSSWTNVSPANLLPVTASSGAVPAPSAYFYDQEHVWVDGATTIDKDGKGSTPVFYTQDGGRTWKSSTVPWGQFNIAAFADAQHGWAFTEAHATAMGLYTLFRTQDGGATWTQVASNRYGVPGNFPGVYMISGFTFRNKSTGWATGRVRDVPLLWLYSTQDGGATWRQQDLELPAVMKDRFVSTGQVRFFGDQNALLPVTARCSDTEECISFFHSTDAGTTWRATAPLRYAIAPFVHQFTTPDQGIATDGVKVYTTADGGEHWSVSTPNISLNGIKRLDFPTRTTGWALTETELLKTTDGGLTWSPVTINLGPRQ